MAGGRIDHKREINGVLYLAMAVILAIAFYLPAGRSGWMGAVLLSLGRGLLGTSALAMPIVFVYMAADYLLEQQIKVTRLRFSYVLMLLLGVAALLHLLTIDQEIFRQLSLGSDQEPAAGKAIATLWEAGIQPDLISKTSTVFPGGVLGGCAAQAMLALAGPTGALVLISAWLLSLLVLLLNVSLSRAVNQTARALQQTRQKVDQAVRSSVASIRETRMTDGASAKSYDIKLAVEQEPGPQEQLEQEENHKPSLLDSLRRLWHAGDEDSLPPSEKCPVPEFLQPENTPATDTTSPAPMENSVGINQRSPFDLKLKGPEWVNANPDASGLAQADPLIYSGLSENDSPPPLPAGVHRLNQTAKDDDTGTLELAETLDETNAVLENGRAHWTDRTSENSSGVAANILHAKTAKAHGAAGAQMAIDLPYQAPPVDLLKDDSYPSVKTNNNAIQALGRKLERTLESFGIQATVVHVTTGPTITRFELTPGPGVKVSRIVSLSDDIALNLAAMGVRIEAPIPGKSAIGIEIPNKETSPVLLRGLLESPEFMKSTSPLTAVIGRDIQGGPILCDLAKMPHLLIAGATGSGKSVCINAILMSILFRSGPEDVRMLMIDPKVVELNVYNGIPHLMAPVVTDPKKAANTLLWAVNEMVRRYGLFAEKSVRDINSYNAAAKRGEEDFEKLPLILLVIDELSDLMATTPTEVEDAIARLTAMARAAGIHLIIATQRPSVDVITGVIKANIPSRIAFAVASQVDSRTILDMAGAEKLLGKGDMLYYPQSSAKPIRGQGAFITDSEVERVLTYIKAQHTAEYDQAITDAIMTAPQSSGKERDSSEQDELLPQALGIIVEAGYASVSLLQRRMNVGYPRAARLIDRMQEMGYVGPFEGSKPRKVLITPTQFLELKAKGEN